MPREDDAIIWGLNKMPDRATDDERYQFGLQNLTKAEVGRLVLLMASMQAERARGNE